MYESYQNKIAVITGAASGLGLGYARRMLAYGAKAVWMADINEKTLAEESAPLIRKYPGKVFPVVANSMAQADIEGLIEHAVGESGQIDLLFNNAGKPMTRPTESLDTKEFEALVQLNLMGVAYGTLAALPHMLAKGSGHIINTASVGGLIPTPYQTAYAATKAAVICMTRCMRYEYASRGIYFSQVSPMNVATNIFKAGISAKLQKEGLSEEEIQKRIQNMQPPKGSLPLDEALDYILEHVEKRDIDIILGQDGRDAYRIFCTDRPAFDQGIMLIAERRKAYFEATARGENVPFPG